MQGRVSLARATRPCRDIHSGAVEPLVPVWRGSTLAPQRAGARTTARVVLENAGGATWRSRGADGLQVSYHWLDTHGNAIVWDGTRTPFPHPVAPGETIELDLPLDAPRPPGRYVLRLDLVEEHRFWLSEIGVPPHDLEVDVAPLIEERRLAVVVHGGPEPANGRRARAPGRTRRRGAPDGNGAPRCGRRARAGLVAARSGRTRRGVGGGRPGDRPARRPARAPASVARLRHVAARRPKPEARRAAPPAVARRWARAGRAPRAAGLAGRRALRGAGGRQASEAIRSSTDLKTSAPSASATNAATTRYTRSPVGGSSPSYSGVR